MALTQNIQYGDLLTVRNQGKKVGLCAKRRSQPFPIYRPDALRLISVKEGGGLFTPYSNWKIKHFTSSKK